MSTSFHFFVSLILHPILADLFVPADRVLDTVDIYFIESRHRRLSLRFLTWAVLKESIQSGEHDSIEDSRCALLLFRAFQEYEEKGVWDEKLEELYKVGKENVSLAIFFKVASSSAYICCAIELEASSGPSTCNAGSHPNYCHSAYSPKHSNYEPSVQYVSGKHDVWSRLR